jgi:hypothetical protein
MEFSQTVAAPISFDGHHSMTGSAFGLNFKMRELRQAMGEIRLEISPEEFERRIRYALSLGLYSAAHLADKAEGERIAVVGSGPSLKDSIPYLKQAKHKIIACNASHDFLLENGIKPWAGMMLDTHDWCEKYQTPTKGVGYFIGSSVHPKVWQRFIEYGIKPWLFIPVIKDDDHEHLLAKYGNEMCLLAGATTVGLRALNFATMLGASVIEAHGFDSCYAPGSNGIKGKNTLHAHPKPFVHHAVKSMTVKSQVTGDTFECLTNDAMAKQIRGYNSFIESLPVHQNSAEPIGTLVLADAKRIGKTRLVVAGDGAIPWMAWKDGGPNSFVEHLDPDRMQAKYGDCKHWDYFNDRPSIEEPK